MKAFKKLRRTLEVIVLTSSISLGLNCGDNGMKSPCTDSDNGNNYYEKGTTTGNLLGGDYIEFTDYCVRAGDHFSERFFELNQEISPDDMGIEEGQCGNIEILDCDENNEYCENGLCTSCDEDGEYTRITETGLATGTHLVPGPNWYKCPSGCQDGACLKD